MGERRNISSGIGIWRNFAGEAILILFTAARTSSLLLWFLRWRNSRGLSLNFARIVQSSMGFASSNFDGNIDDHSREKFSMSIEKEIIRVASRHFSDLSLKKTQWKANVQTKSIAYAKIFSGCVVVHLNRSKLTIAAKKDLHDEKVRVAVELKNTSSFFELK